MPAVLTALATNKRRAGAKKKSGPDAIARAAETGNWSTLARAASAELRRARSQIDAGETFASQKPHGREPAPSAKRSGKNS